MALVNLALRADEKVDGPKVRDVVVPAGTVIGTRDGSVFTSLHPSYTAGEVHGRYLAGKVVEVAPEKKK